MSMRDNTTIGARLLPIQLWQHGAFHKGLG